MNLKPLSLKYLAPVALTAAILTPGMARAQAAITVDPALTAAIGTQTITLQEEYKKRRTLKEEIIAFQALCFGAMEEIHRVESEALGYLKNASVAVENLYQIKESVELITYKIPDQIIKLTNAVGANPKGAAISAVVSKNLINLGLEMTSLYGFMEDMVKNTEYSFNFKDKNTGAPTNKKGKQINLATASERMYIANKVVFGLRRIHQRLWFLTWQVKTYGFREFFRYIDPQTYGNYMIAKYTANRTINRWKQLKW